MRYDPHKESNRTMGCLAFGASTVILAAGILCDTHRVSDEAYVPSQEQEEILTPSDLPKSWGRPMCKRISEYAPFGAGAVGFIGLTLLGLGYRDKLRL